MQWVVANPSLNFSGQGHEKVSDRWTMHVEGSKQMPSTVCAVRHGLFDSVFHRCPIRPDRWQDFNRQYLSPEMLVLERMNEACNEPDITSLLSMGPERKSFYMHRDRLSETTQKKQFSDIVSKLRAQGVVSLPSRKYADDPDAFGMCIGEKIVDMPGSFKHLRMAVESQYAKWVYQGDFPKEFQLYDAAVPVLFLLADTVVADKSNPGNSGTTRFLEVLREFTSPKPKYQSLLYVLAEKNGTLYTPRIIGTNAAYMLEFANGTPSGKKIFRHDMEYMVPLPDLAQEEKESLEISGMSWESHCSYILEAHPDVFM
ncbi:MAG TPA: hypothetical protein VN420_05195 [Candidatus Fimivivens sp.]|nr:hypothetical protein [Candidatus Fimivivens sp.]